MRLDYNHSPLQCKQCHVQVHLLQDKDDQQDGVEDDHDEEVYQDADLFGEGLADIPADPLPNNPFLQSYEPSSMQQRVSEQHAGEVLLYPVSLCIDQAAPDCFCPLIQ